MPRGQAQLRALRLVAALVSAPALRRELQTAPKLAAEVGRLRAAPDITQAPLIAFHS